MVENAYHFNTYLLYFTAFIICTLIVNIILFELIPEMYNENRTRLRHRRIIEMEYERNSLI